MDRIAGELQAALVAAFRPYVRACLADRGWQVPDEVIDASASWLDDALADLLSRPFDEQPRGPLEVFQEALTGPTESLLAAGVSPVDRDPVTVAALPGDHFGLAPASSAALGEVAWQAHLAWGAAKAAAASRPMVGTLSANLLDRDRIEQSVGQVRWMRAGGDSSGLVVLFVDLEHPDADEVIATASAAGVRVVAYGPHVDDLAMVRARSLGAAEAVPRSRFFKDPASLVPPIV